MNMSALIIIIIIIVLMIIATWWPSLCEQTSCLRDRQGPTRSVSISQSEGGDDEDHDGDDDDDNGDLFDVRDLEVSEDIWAVAAAHHIVAGRVAPGDHHDHVDDDYDYYDDYDGGGAGGDSDKYYKLPLLKRAGNFAY